MTFRKKLEDKVKKKEQEIVGYEARIAEAKAYLQGLQEALKLLPREEAQGDIAETVLRQGSAAHKTFEMLKNAGKPVHILEIIKSIGSENTKKKRLALGSSLSRYVRNGEIFNRPAPNTFGLLSWESEIETTDNSKPDKEPPNNFGT